MNPADLAASFVAVFVPIFVAMDPVGALPLVFAWTADLKQRERERQLRDALITALALCLLFMFGGQWFLGLLGVTVADFLVAGGLVLLALAISDLVLGGGHEARGLGHPDFGAVPIGTPILAGPATLASIVVLVERFGPVPTLVALLLNLLIAWQLFRRAGVVTRVVGRNGLRAASKVASLLLAAIAIKLIREGVLAILPPG